MRKGFAYFGLAVVIFIAGIMTGQEMVVSSARQSLARAVVEPTASPSPEASPSATGKSYEFAGKNDDVTEVFTLTRGAHVLTASNEGKSNFVVTLYNESGEVEDLLVNEIGTYSGKVVIPVRATGSYFLGIESNGNWTLTIEE